MATAGPVPVARFSARPVGLAALVAAAAIGLVACGGSTSGHVASLPSVESVVKRSGDLHGSVTKLAKDNPTRLVDEWAACERRHGDPNQADPIIDVHGVINITLPAPGQGGPAAAPVAPVAGDPHDVTGTCSEYLAAAQRELRAADPVQDPLGMTNQADLLRYVACMRSTGVPNYPYPSGPNDRETNFNGTGVDPNSPSVLRVSIKCGNRLRLPLWWSAGWGPPGDVSVGMSIPPGAPPPGPLGPATGAPTADAPPGLPGTSANTGAGAGG